MPISIANRDNKVFILSNPRDTTPSKVVVTLPEIDHCYHFEPLTAGEEKAITNYLKSIKPDAKLRQLNLMSTQETELKDLEVKFQEILPVTY